MNYLLLVVVVVVVVVVFFYKFCSNNFGRYSRVLDNDIFLPFSDNMRLNIGKGTTSDQNSKLSY